MAYQSGNIEAALAQAVGEEPSLIAELRQAFTEGAARHASDLATAGSDEAWRLAAHRLLGLAASFGATGLMQAAQAAAAAPCGDAARLAAVRMEVAGLSA